MADEGFASGLWKNVRAIKLGPDGGIEAPVRADGHHGIVGGVNHVAASEQPRTDGEVAGLRRRGWWHRLLGH